jgi:AcrR family transcriptional regulator
MTNYANGIATRKTILESCKKLFLEKGYKATTYAEICQAAGVYPATITHHFKSKRVLMSGLYDEMLADIQHETERIFSSVGFVQQVIIAHGIHLKLIFENPAYRRIAVEFAEDYAKLETFDEYVSHSSKAYVAATHYMTAEQAEFHFTACKGLDSTLETFIADNLGTYSLEEAFTYYNFFYFYYLGEQDLVDRNRRALESLGTIKPIFDDFHVRVAELEQPEEGETAYNA